MKRLVFALFLVFTVASGCTTSHPWYGSRQDPVVGRTTDGHRIYEDRRGRLYTLDRYGRRVYRGDADVYRGSHGKYRVKKAKPPRGNTKGHPRKGRKRDRDWDWDRRGRD